MATAVNRWVVSAHVWGSVNQGRQIDCSRSFNLSHGCWLDWRVDGKTEGVADAPLVPLMTVVVRIRRVK